MPTKGVTQRRVGDLDCMVMGSGPPLVLLPGLSPENCLPVGPIRSGEIQTMSQFSKRFTVHWVGRPMGLAKGTSFADMTAVLAEHLRREFDVPVNVLGISTGGSFAQQLAAEHPELVKRMVLLSSGSRLGDHAAHTQHVMIKIAARGRPRLLMAAYAWDIVPPWRGRTPAALGMFLGGLRLYPGARDLHDIQAMLDAELEFDLRSLPAISAPTLIINGGKDRFYERAIIDETADLIPGSRLLVYPDRGHVTVVSDKRAVREANRFLAE